jgi:hypothetical protein
VVFCKNRVFYNRSCFRAGSRLTFDLQGSLQVRRLKFALKFSKRLCEYFVLLPVQCAQMGTIDRPLTSWRLFKDGDIHREGGNEAARPFSSAYATSTHCQARIIRFDFDAKVPGGLGRFLEISPVWFGVRGHRSCSPGMIGAVPWLEWRWLDLQGSSAQEGLLFHAFAWLCILFAGMGRPEGQVFCPSTPPTAIRQHLKLERMVRIRFLGLIRLRAIMESVGTAWPY